MKAFSLFKSGRNWPKRISLHIILVLPFVLQIFGTVGLVGYLSFKNGQKAVNKLATDLQVEVESKITQHLDSYLAIPHQIIKTDLDASWNRYILLKTKYFLLLLQQDNCNYCLSILHQLH